MISKITKQSDPLGMFKFFSWEDVASYDPQFDIKITKKFFEIIRSLLDPSMNMPEYMKINGILEGEDPISIALLKSMNIRPEGFYFLKNKFKNSIICIVDAEGENKDYIFSYILSESHGINIHSNEITWNDGKHLTLPGIPETIVANLKGKKLSEIFSHPIFDTFDINIIRPVKSIFGTILEVELADKA